MKTSTSNLEVSKWLHELEIELPLQNPLYAFLHNNALMAFEKFPFFQGIFHASRRYDARTLPSGDRYRELMKLGKIDPHLLDLEIERYLQAHPTVLLTPTQLRTILLKPIKFRTPQPSFESLRSEAFWIKKGLKPFSQTIRETLIPIAQSYLDQGQAPVKNPFQKLGLLSFFENFLRHSTTSISFPKAEILNELEKVKKNSLEECIQKELEATGYEAHQQKEYLFEVAFHLKGWSGMFCKFKNDPSLSKRSDIKEAFQDWIYLLLLLERLFHEGYSRSQLKKTIKISATYLGPFHPRFEQGLKVLEYSKRNGIQPKNEESFLSWLEEFGRYDRFIIWQKALEATCGSELRKKLSQTQSEKIKRKPKAHFLFCIDDREESIRRHLENAHDGIATAGVVGFFGLDMNFNSYLHPEPIRQCPPVVEPKYLCEETAPYTNQNFDQNWVWTLKRILFRSSRTLVGGTLSSFLLGPLAALEMLRKIIFKQKDLFAEERKSFQSLKTNYSVQEKAKRVELICKMAGFYSSDDFSNQIIVVSHGSTTTNNPFRQAYGCGACSGNSGEVNSIVFCEFANDPEVRSALLNQGYAIPISVRFLPAHHDTCQDKIRFHFPETDLSQDLRDAIQSSLEENAKERLKRLSPIESPHHALEKVRSRATDYAQPRPEFGHSGVRMAVFAPRSRTLGIHLNRESFLVDYHDDQDLDSSVLRETLIGALPVCANIGLDYFFSSNDPERLGAGSKLPLNITSLVGVITGSKSDLRIGLAKQMTEIHIPYRMHIFIESTPEKVIPVLNSHSRLKTLFQNEWVLIFLIHPKEHTITELRPTC